MARYVNPVPDYPYAPSGKLFFFVSNTTTAKNTYADINETILNPNPVPIDGDGKVPNIFYTGSARVVCEDKDGVQQWERDPVEASGGGGSFSEWSALNIYSTDEVVIDGGDYYRSLIDGNQNNDPSSTPTAWNLVQFLEDWNTNITYGDNDIVFYQGKLYVSVQAANMGNNPATSNQWFAQGFEAEGFVPVDPSTTFDGYGVTSISRPATGVVSITFDKAATGQFKQIVSAQDTSPNGTDVYQCLPEYIDASTVEIHNWFINTGTGVWTKQNNLARITIQRTLIE